MSAECKRLNDGAGPTCSCPPNVCTLAAIQGMTAIKKRWVEDDFQPRVGYASVANADALVPVADKPFAPVRAGDIVHITIVASASPEQPDEEEDPEVVRVDGRVICDQCGKPYRDHPDDPELPWPTFVLLCDGTHAKT